MSRVFPYAHCNSSLVRKRRRKKRRTNSDARTGPLRRPPRRGMSQERSNGRAELPSDTSGALPQRARAPTLYIMRGGLRCLGKNVSSFPGTSNPVLGKLKMKGATDMIDSPPLGGQGDVRSTA